MSSLLIDISLTPVCLKSCRQRFAVCSGLPFSHLRQSRDFDVELIIVRWTDNSTFQMNRSILKVGRRHQRLNLTWVSLSLSPQLHISWMPGVHRTVQIQIQTIWPCSLAMNRRHDYLQLDHFLRFCYQFLHNFSKMFLQFGNFISQ